MSDLKLRVSLTALDKATGPMRRVQEAARGMAGGMAAAQKKLADLNRAQRNMAALRQHVADQKAAKREWHAATIKIKELAQQHASAAKVTKEMAREMRAAKANAARLKETFFAQGRAAQAMRDKLKAAGIQTANLAAHEKRVRAEIERTTRAIERQHKARAMSAKMAKTGAAMSAAGTGGVLLGREAGRRTIGFMDTGKEFEATMSRVQALTRLQKESAELNDLRNQARRLGAETMFSATQAAQGQAFLAMAGFEPRQIMDAMPGLLDMAKAGDMELGRSADIASNILSAFGLAADQMGMVSDVLTRGFTTANVNLEMLGETMTYTGTIAKEFGADLKTTVAMSGLLGNAGIQASQAGTALRSMYTRLAAPPKEARDSLKELSVRTRDSAGNMRNIVEIISDVAKATAKLGNGDRLGHIEALFGKPAAAGLAALIAQGEQGITKYLGVIRDSDGAAAQTARTMADNWGGALDEMSSAWDDVKISFYDQNAPLIREMTQQLTGVIRKVGDLLAQNPMLAKALFWAAAGASVLLVAVGALAVPLGLVLAKAAMLRWGLARLGLALPGIGGLLARLGTVGAGAWRMLVTGATTAGRWLVRAGAAGTSAMRMLAQAVASAAAKAGAWIARFGAVALRALALVGRGAMMFMATPLGVAFALVAAAVALWVTRWDDIKAGAIALWGDIKQAFSDGLDYLRSMPQRMWQAGSDIMAGLVDGISAKLGAVRDSIRGVADQAAGWFKGALGINSPSRVFMGLGGWVSEGAALGIQQRAPLVARAAARMAALPALAAAPALAVGVPAIGASPAPAASAPAYHITIHAQPGQDAQAIARAVSAELDRRERQRAARGYSHLGDR